MIQKRVLWPAPSLCVLAFLLIFLNGAASRIEAAPAQDEAPVAGAPLSCRYGVALSASYPNQASWVEPLGAAWYLDFTARTPSSLTSMEFVQVIRVRQNMDADCNYVPGYTTSPSLTKAIVGSLAAAHRGAVWIIGNEPDRGANPEDIGKKDRYGDCYRGQDDSHPEVYAQVYHDAYALIKSSDPTARVAVAGLVQVTPGRLQYLDKVWEAYRTRYGSTMPVDVWNFHLYILPEADSLGQPNGLANVALGTDVALAKRDSGGSAANCGDWSDNIYCYAEHDDMSIFAAQVVAMRQWMKNHGYQNKPLILTEYSILYPFADYDDPVNPTTCYLRDEYGNCFTADRVRNFMTRSFDYLDSAADPDLGYPADQNRLVQRWLWFGTFFSANPESAGYASNLLTDSQDALSLLGQFYQGSVAGRSTYVNLRVDPIPPLSAYASAGVATASLPVNVYNAGTAPTGGPFTVTFYDGVSNQPIGSAVVAAGLAGCEARRVTVTVPWSNLAVGRHSFWVQIDSGGAIAESDETDNTADGSVTVLPYRLVLPLIFRSR
jgi:hypothetical protein